MRVRSGESGESVGTEGLATTAARGTYDVGEAWVEQCCHLFGVRC